MSKEIEQLEGMIRYDRDCPHCNGEGLIEHIEENIAEDCEHCLGTGRKNRLSDSDIMSKNIVLSNL